MPPRIDQLHHPSDSARTGSKRRRIALACNTCRIRKSRCDGQRPTCSTCSDLNLECQYEPPDSSTNVIVRKEYVSDLEQRLKDVERVLQRHDDLLTGHLSVCTPACQSRYDAQPDELSKGATRIDDGTQLDSSELEEPSEDDYKEAETDGLAITFVDERASVYFGESSNIRFARYLLGAISAIWKVQKLERPPAGDKDLASKHSLVDITGQCSPLAMESPQYYNPSPSMLPPATEIEGMLRSYFNSMGSLFPFLHEPTFWGIYSQFKASGFSKVRKTWLGALNMIFAMAVNIDTGRGMPSKKRFKSSLVFYGRAVALCSEPLLRTVSLDIVHYLLLQVLYLQGTQHSIQVWSIHGLLVRTAIALGLHCDHTGQHFDLVQQETRRRTWHTIYCLDKVLSVTFGRPSAIPDDYMTVQLPAPWPPSDSPTESDERNLIQYNTDFLSASVRLYQIMGRSLTQQYNSNLGGKDQDTDEIATIQAAGEMRQELRRWVTSLPPILSILPQDSCVLSQSSKLHKLRTILTLRYHNVNILIHRPLICATLRYLSTHDDISEEELPYTSQLAMAEAYECVTSAERTITIVSTILATNVASDNNLGVWFFTLYYVVTASLIVCSHMLWARHGRRQNADAFITSGRSFLTKAAEALRKLDNGNHLVYQYAKYIYYLAELQDGRFMSIRDEVDKLADDSKSEASQTAGASSGRHAETPAELTDMSGFLVDNGELGPFLATELFDDTYLFNGFMPGQQE